MMAMLWKTALNVMILMSWPFTEKTRAKEFQELFVTGNLELDLDSVSTQISTMLRIVCNAKIITSSILTRSVNIAQPKWTAVLIV
jgi:hypothetical protein